MATPLAPPGSPPGRSGTASIGYAEHAPSLVAELAAGDVFAERWQAPPARLACTGVERWAHPEIGTVRLAYEALEMAAEEQRLVVYLPADQLAAAALDRLAGRQPGALRAVAG